MFIALATGLNLNIFAEKLSKFVTFSEIFLCLSQKYRFLLSRFVNVGGIKTD